MKINRTSKPIIGRTISKIVTQRKSVKAEAEIIEYNNKPNSSKPYTIKTIKDITGYARTKRENPVPNETIERVLTQESQKNNKGRGITLRNGSKLPIIKSTKVTDVMGRRPPANGWGNCAEPHAAYVAVSKLRSNQYLKSLKIARAITVDAGYHNDIDDARCSNCQQWCADNMKKDSILPSN
ncbi:MAG: hypothetical protein UD961_10815 [Bacteroidales bacterium]|nr:hypothetical protein [Bacteroidales bacterium]